MVRHPRSRTPKRKPTNILKYRDWDHFNQFLREYSSQDRPRREPLLFRGQSSHRWTLTTTLDRERRFATDGERESFFSNLIEEFRREAIRLGSVPSAFQDTEALELLARHHGLLSPLLDWTESPYIAAYFAFENATVSADHGVVIWILDRARFDPLESRVNLIDDLELIRFNQRALQQRSLFLRVLTGQRSLEDILDGALTKIEIPGSSRKNALADLDQMTINGTYLFADLDGAARTARTRLFELNGMNMREQQFIWEPPPLDPADERLIEAYRTIGRPLDDLPYTPDFERPRELVAAEDSDEARHQIFRRLLRLRKMGRLPRLSMLAD